MFQNVKKSMNTLREHIGISHEPNRNYEKNGVKILEAKDTVSEGKVRKRIGYCRRNVKGGKQK